MKNNILQKQKKHLFLKCVHEISYKYDNTNTTYENIFLKTMMKIKNDITKINQDEKQNIGIKLQEIESEYNSKYITNYIMLFLMKQTNKVYLENIQNVIEHINLQIQLRENTQKWKFIHQIPKYVRRLKKTMKKSCYMKILDMLFKLLGIEEQMSVELIMNIIHEKQIPNAFNANFSLNILVIENILNNFQYQLHNMESDINKLLAGKSNLLEKLRNAHTMEFIIHYKNHYLLLVKFIEFYYLIGPDYKTILRFTEIEILEFLINDETSGFYIEKLNNDYSLKNDLHNILFGGTKSKNIFQTNDDAKTPKQKRKPQNENQSRKRRKIEKKTTNSGTIINNKNLNQEMEKENGNISDEDWLDQMLDEIVEEDKKNKLKNMKKPTINYDADDETEKEEQKSLQNILEKTNIKYFEEKDLEKVIDIDENISNYKRNYENNIKKISIIDLTQETNSNLKKETNSHLVNEEEEYINVKDEFSDFLWRKREYVDSCDSDGNSFTKVIKYSKRYNSSDSHNTLNISDNSYHICSDEPDSHHTVTNSDNSYHVSSDEYHDEEAIKKRKKEARNQKQILAAEKREKKNNIYIENGTDCFTHFINKKTLQQYDTKKTSKTKLKYLKSIEKIQKIRKL